MNSCIICSKGAIIFDDLTNSNCRSCIELNQVNGYAHINCKNDNAYKRIAFQSNKYGQLYACSANAKTTRLFKNEVSSIITSLRALVALFEKISNDAYNKTVEETTKRVDRVIHNLKSINAHAIQELYTLIPQEQLTHNIKETSNIVEQYIAGDTKKAALTFLRMAKLNLSIKAEFSIYEKLLKGNSNLDFRNHNIRDVVMIVLYMFFADFSEKNVRVNVVDYYEKTKLDFESFQVAIYHLIENASKYIAPNSNAEISFKRNKESHTITFSMLSLYINPEEETEIFNEGYSGVQAKRTKKAGNGIGMYRAQKLIQLNNGELTLEAGDNQQRIDDYIYADNKFIITLPI